MAERAARRSQDGPRRRARPVPPAQRKTAAADNQHSYAIIRTYGSEYRGFAQYYMPTANVSALNRLRWDIERSILTTLADKHRATP